MPRVGSPGLPAAFAYDLDDGGSVVTGSADLAGGPHDGDFADGPADRAWCSAGGAQVAAWMAVAETFARSFQTADDADRNPLVAFVAQCAAISEASGR